MHKSPPTPLDPILRDIIRAQGPISVEDYMQTVLHHPQHGFYRHGDRLAHDGDFSTGPEASQMFGEMIGAWAVDTWRRMGKPDPFILLELGPGRGTLMRSLLDAVAQVEGFLPAMRLYLMESNATLRALQQERLADYAPAYIESIDALPALPLLVAANEFFDTFPMRQFVRTLFGWRERMVKTDLFGRLRLTLGKTIKSPPDLPLTTLFPLGSYYETSPRTLSLVRQLASHIARHRGGGVVIDYGYMTPPRENSLFAFRKQKHVDILFAPGETDVTGDVDFAALARIATAEGVLALALIEQGTFFKRLGIGARAMSLASHSREHAGKIYDEMNRLTAPSQMGAWFKVLGLVDKQTAEMVGF